MMKELTRRKQLSREKSVEQRREKVHGKRARQQWSRLLSKWGELLHTPHNSPFIRDFFEWKRKPEQRHVSLCPHKGCHFWPDIILLLIHTVFFLYCVAPANAVCHIRDRWSKGHDDCNIQKFSGVCRLTNKARIISIQEHCVNRCEQGWAIQGFRKCYIWHKENVPWSIWMMKSICNFPLLVACSQYLLRFLVEELQQILRHHFSWQKLPQKKYEGSEGANSFWGGLVAHWRVVQRVECWRLQSYLYNGKNLVCISYLRNPDSAAGSTKVVREHKFSCNAWQRIGKL